MNSRPAANEDAPLVSVIVAVFDVRPWLAQCLATIAAQTWRRLEIIVVDDGSRDGGEVVAARFAETDDRVRLIRQANAGLSAARNAGLARATGAYIAFVDGDDYVAHDFVETLLARLRSEGAAMAACGLCLDHGGRLTHHSGLHQHRQNENAPAEAVMHADDPAALRLFPSAWNKLYRRDVVEGLRFPEGLQFEDHPFFLAALRRAGRIAYTSRPLYIYRRDRPGQITGRSDQGVFDVFPIIRLVREERDRFSAALGQAFDAYVYRLLWERVCALQPGPLLFAFIQAAQVECEAELTALDGKPELRDAFIPPWSDDLFGGRATLSVLVPAGPEAAVHEIARVATIAAKQSLRSLEIIVLLHGTPERESALAGLMAEEPRLRLLHIDAEADFGTARNKLVGAACGRWFIFLEVGDDLYPDSYDRLLWTAWQDGADLVVGAVAYRRRDGGSERYHTALHAHIEAGRWPIADPVVLAADLWATPCNKLISTDLARRTAATFDPGPFGEHGFHVRLARAGAVAAYTEAPVYLIEETAPFRALWKGPVRDRGLFLSVQGLAAALDEHIDQPPWRAVFVRLVYRLAWERVHFSWPEPDVLEDIFGLIAREFSITRGDCLRYRDPYADDAALRLFPAQNDEARQLSISSCDGPDARASRPDRPGET